MTKLIQIEPNGVPVVDSRIIAEKCGIQHKNALELIDVHKDSIEPAFGRVAFETATLSTAGGPQKMRFALLTEDQATFLITLTRNTAQVVAFKVALVKAFAEARRQLEAKPAFVLPDFTNPAIAARAWADEVEAKQQLQLENAKLTPKAEFYDEVVGSPDLMHLNEAAKVLNMGRNKLMAGLRKHGIFQDNNTPYQTYIDRGYFKLASSKWTDREGNVHITLTTMVRAKGLAYLRKCVKRLREMDARAKIEAQANFPTIAAQPEADKAPVSPSKFRSLVESCRRAINGANGAS